MFGTVTVWINYSKGTKLARELLARVNVEERVLPRREPAQKMWDADKWVPPYQVTAVEDRERTTRKWVAEQLTSQRFVRSGLVAYVVGVLAGLGAGLIAIYAR